MSETLTTKRKRKVDPAVSELASRLEDYANDLCRHEYASARDIEDIILEFQGSVISYAERDELKSLRREVEALRDSELRLLREVRRLSSGGSSS